MLVNKKANASSVVDWIFALAFTILLFIIIVLLVSSFKLREIDTRELDVKTYTLRIYYDQEIFSPDSQTSFGVIDIEKFTQENIDENFRFVEPFITSRLTLYEQDGEEIKEIIHDERLFQERFPLAVVGVRGAGSGYLERLEYPVRIYENGNVRSGRIVMEVIVPW